MVWCNELVVLLARLLQTIAQTKVLKQHSQRAVQRQIVQQMRHATQPKVASALRLAQRSAIATALSRADTPHEQQTAPYSCSAVSSGADAGKQILQSQFLLIQGQSGQRCTNRCLFHSKLISSKQRFLDTLFHLTYSWRPHYDSHMHRCSDRATV